MISFICFVIFYGLISTTRTFVENNAVWFFLGFVVEFVFAWIPFLYREKWTDTKSYFSFLKRLFF